MFLLSPILKFLHIILGLDTPHKFPPPLSSEEEEEAFQAAGKGDEDARQRLILHNLRLVSHIVRKYYATARNQEDLVSIGTIGLCKAVDSFKTDNGARFATYAAKCIQNEILMHFRSQRKLTSEVSMNETIDVDRDGNPLTYTDVISSEEDLPEEVMTGAPFSPKRRVMICLSRVSRRVRTSAMARSASTLRMTSSGRSSSLEMTSV